jgi:hypothetical protein
MLIMAGVFIECQVFRPSRETYVDAHRNLLCGAKMKLAKRPFHLAWFISKGYGPKAWRLPWRGPNPSSWIKPDLLVALAQALERAAFDNVMIEDSSNPNLLIADEPTTALDVTVQARVMDLIDRIRREFDIAVLFISHNLELVAEIADRMTVMYAGRAASAVTERGEKDLVPAPRAVGAAARPRQRRRCRRRRHHSHRARLHPGPGR